MSGSDSGARFILPHILPLCISTQNGRRRHVEERKRPLSVPILAKHTHKHTLPASATRSHTAFSVWFSTYPRGLGTVSFTILLLLLLLLLLPLLLLHLVASLGRALELQLAERRQQAATPLVGSSSGWQRHAAEAHGCAEIRNGLRVLAVSSRVMLDDYEQEGQVIRYRWKAGF